jgi:threonine synthase
MSDNFLLHLTCMICGREYDPDEVDYVCPEHGAEGILDAVYDYAAIRQRLSPAKLAGNNDNTIWRYGPLLPCDPVPALKVGDTPLHDAPRLAARFGLKRLLLKDDGRLPTGSLKDRASAVAIARASEAGAEVITTASTGNAAAALAGLCAVTGQRNIIFVPATAPQAKIAQLLAYGATVLLVEGSYDDAFELCMGAAAAFGWYNRNTGFNPYMSEGKKTVSFEICEQLDWQAPDNVFVSVGDGCIIGGVYKGFYELLILGWIDRMPRIIGVQAAGSSYLAQAWERDEDVLTKPPIQAMTAADSISAGLPRDRLKAMRAVQESGGAFVTVSDEAILNAIPILAQGSGVFAEPAAAATYAGLHKAVDKGLISVDETSVLLITGSGLKDIAGVMDGVSRSGIAPHSIPPRLDAVRQLFETP